MTEYLVTENVIDSRDNDAYILKTKGYSTVYLSLVLFPRRMWSVPLKFNSKRIMSFLVKAIGYMIHTV